MALHISHRTINRGLQQRVVHAYRTPHPPSHALTLAISLVLPVRRWDCPFPGPMNYGPDSPAIWLPEEDVLDDPTLVRKVWPVLFPSLHLQTHRPYTPFRVLARCATALPARVQQRVGSGAASDARHACDARMNGAGLSALEEEGASSQSPALVAQVTC